MIAEDDCTSKHVSFQLYIFLPQYYSNPWGSPWGLFMELGSVFSTSDLLDHAKNIVNIEDSNTFT